MQSVQFHFIVIAQWKQENVEANDGKRKNVYGNYGSLWRSSCFLCAEEYVDTESEPGALWGVT